MLNVEIPDFGIVEFPDDMPEEAINAAIAQNFRFDTPSPIASGFSPAEKLPAGTMMPIPIEGPTDLPIMDQGIPAGFNPATGLPYKPDEWGDVLSKTGEQFLPRSRASLMGMMGLFKERQGLEVSGRPTNATDMIADKILRAFGRDRPLLVSEEDWNARQQAGEKIIEGAKPYYELGESYMQEAQAKAPEVIPGSGKEFVSELGGTVADMTVPVLMGILTRGAGTVPATTVGVTAMTPTVAGQQALRDKEVTPEQRQMRAGLYTLAEEIPEMVPMGFLLGKGKGLFKRVIETTVGEGVQEELTNILQAAIDKGTIDPSMTWGEVLKSGLDPKTFLLGAAAGGTLAVATHPVQKAQEMAERKEAQRQFNEGWINFLQENQQAGPLFKAVQKPKVEPAEPPSTREKVMQAFETREQQEATQKAADEARADTDSVRTKIMDSLRAQQTERDIGGERITPRTAMEDAFRQAIEKPPETDVSRGTRQNQSLTEPTPSGIKTDLPTGLNIESFQREDTEGRPVNPVDSRLPPMEKAKALHVLGRENDSVVKEALAAVDAAIPGAKSTTNFKALEKIVAKGRRATVKAKRPYWDVEYVRDSYRFRTVIPDLSQAPKALEKLLSEMEQRFKAPVEVLKIDLDKLDGNGMFGWRVLPVDFRMPNGQIVEYYFTTPELQEAQDTGGHQLFEDWRERDLDSLSPEESAKLYKFATESKRLYENAWASGAARLGIDPNAVAASVKSAFASSPLATGQRETSTTLRPGGGFPQVPSAERKAISPEGERTKTRLPPGSTETMGSPDIAVTSKQSIAGVSRGVKTGDISVSGVEATPPAWLKQNSFDPQYDPFSDVTVTDDEVTDMRARSINIEDTEKYGILRKYYTQSVGRLFDEQFPVVARALKMLHEAGLPKSSLLTIEGFISHRKVRDTFEMVHWGIPENVGNNSILGIAHEVLEYARQNPTDKRGQFAMLVMLAHEIGHALDIRKGFFHSVNSPLFDLEIVPAPKGYDVRIGPVLNELMMAHGKNSMGLSQYLAYPMAWVKEYADSITEEQKNRLEVFIQKESFAQLYALYYTVGQTTSGREALMKVMPQAMKFMDEVHHATATVHTVAERDRGVRQAFQVDSPVGGEMEGPRMAAREGTAGAQDRGAGEGVRGVRDADTGRGVVRPVVVRPVVETPGTTEDNARHARDTREAERAEPARDTGQAGRTAGEAAPDLSRRAGREADRGVERAGLAFESAKADDFHQAITEAKEASRFGSSVAVYSKAEYAKMKTFLLPDKSAGFALKGDDLVSVFSSGTHPGIASDILDQAIAQGARRLDAFDTRLPGIYSTKGFKAVARLKWNDEFAPADWNKYTYRNFNNGKPDVVFMVYDPNAPLYKPGDGKLVESYDEAVRLQDEALQGKIDVAATRAVPQTETPEFKRWFGDSKVVDDDGKPLVVYRSNAVDSVLSGKPQIPESGMDGLRGNAELLSNLLQSPTFRTEGLGGFDTPTQRVVLAAVRSFSLNPQILGSVVDLVPVDVVDILARGKASPDSLFRDDAVLKNLLSVDGEGSVSTAVDVADALVAAVASVTTEASGVSVYGVGPLLNGRAAGRAGEVNVFLSSHDGALSAVDATSVAQKSNTVGNRGTFDPNVPDISGTGLAPPRPPVTPPISPSPDSPRRRSAMSIYDKKVGKPPKPFLGILKEWTSGRRFEHEFLDTGIPFKLMVEKVAPDIGPQDNPYIGWKLLSGDSALIEDWLGINPGTQGGAPFRLGDRIKVENYGKSLREILAPVAHDAETLKEFEAYLIGRRANELYGKEKEHLFTRKEIDELLALETPAFKKVAEEVYAYNDRLLQYSVDGGFLDPKVAEKFREYVNYIPFYREAEYEGDVGGPRKGSLYHRLKGGKQNLRSPLQNLIDNTATVIHAVNRNAVLNNALDMSKAFPGAKAWMEQVPVPMQVMNLATDRIVNQLVGQGVYVNRETADELAVMQTFFMKKPIGDEKNRIIILKRNGKTIAVKIHDPMLWKTLHAFTPTELGLIVDILAVPAQTLRTGVVVSPDFMSRNFLRDTLSAYIQGDKTFIPVVGSIKGFVHVARASETYRLYRAMGGAYADFWHGDSKEAAVSLSRLAKLSLFPGSRLLNPAGWWRTLKKVGSITEAGSRTRALEKYIDGTIEGALKGAVEAREVTVDFGMHGVNQTMRILERITPFLNPAKQGMYKMSRTFGNHPMTTLLRGAPIVLLTFALWMLNRDEKWYKDLEDWEKDMYWHFDVGLRTDKGKVVPLRLPKPFEYGAVFGSFWEAGLESMYREDAEGMKRAWGTIENVFTLRMIPTVASVPLELWSNKSLFTERSIVPEGMETLEPYLQYGAGTSNVSKAVGQAFNASPYKIDHTVRNVFGTLGVYATSLMDHPVGNAMGYPSKPAVRPQQWPLLKVFVSDPDRGGNKAVTEFYELLQESRTRYASWSYLQYDFDYLDKQAEKSGDLMFLKDTAENAAHIMAELRKSNRMIRDDKTLTPEQKRVLIDENGEQIKQIAETYRDLLKGAKR